MRLFALTPFVVVAAACGPAAKGPPPTYASAAKKIVDAKCTGCHHDGGIGPMPLTTYAEIEPFLDLMEGDVRSKNMPPWPADDSCNRYANDFSLTDDEYATLMSWFEAGAPEGDRKDDAPLAANDGDPRASGIRVDAVLEMNPEPYVPEERDEYRCFAMAWPYDHDVYVTGFDFLPGDASNVHHVNVFVNPPGDEADAFLAFEADDPLAGYSCNHGSSVDFPMLLGSWAPGASGMKYPEGTGQLVAPDSVVTVQIHYAGPGGPDLSELALQIDEHVERRGVAAPFWWFNYWEDGNMRIPAGAPAVSFELDTKIGVQLAALAPWFDSDMAEIDVVALHMHELGSSGEIAVHSPVGDTCLLDIPKWDFHRQMGYALKRPAEFYLPEDSLYLRCTFDNSRGDHDVNWGLGTSDEMCIGYLYLVPVR